MLVAPRRPSASAGDERATVGEGSRGLATTPSYIKCYGYAFCQRYSTYGNYTRTDSGTDDRTHPPTDRLPGHGGGDSGRRYSGGAIRLVGGSPKRDPALGRRRSIRRAGASIDLLADRLPGQGSGGLGGRHPGRALRLLDRPPRRDPTLGRRRPIRRAGEPSVVVTRTHERRKTTLERTTPHRWRIARPSVPIFYN